MRTGITVVVSTADRRRLAAIVVRLTAEGCGTAEIMRRADASKTTVWRWQERYMIEGIAGLLRDKTRPPRIPPLAADVEAAVVSRTLAEPAGEMTHWTAPAMAKLSGISVSSVQRIW